MATECPLSRDQLEKWLAEAISVICDNSSAWEDEECSVQREHRALMRANEKFLDDFMKVARVEGDRIVPQEPAAGVDAAAATGATQSGSETTGDDHGLPELPPADVI